MRRIAVLKRMTYLATAALLFLLVLTAPALAQDTDLMQPEENAVVVDEGTLQQISGQPLPETGGLDVGAFVLMPVGLLLASGILSYVVVRSR